MRDDLTALTPRLRRYARALLSGCASPCDRADSLVHATLMRAVGTRGLGTADLAVRLYATVTQLHRDLAPSARAESSGPADRLAAALLRLAVDEREALLLVALEGFDHATAARILRLSRPALVDSLTRARTALERHLAAPPVAAATRPPARAAHLRLVVG